MAVSVDGTMSPENWQEWHDDWMRRISAAAREGDWEACAMHWYPLRWDGGDDDPSPLP